MIKKTTGLFAASVLATKVYVHVQVHSLLTINLKSIKFWKQEDFLKFGMHLFGNETWPDMGLFIDLI